MPFINATPKDRRWSLPQILACPWFVPSPSPGISTDHTPILCIKLSLPFPEAGFPVGQRITEVRHLARVTRAPEAQGLTSIQGRVDGQCRAVSGPQPLTLAPVQWSHAALC